MKDWREIIGITYKQTQEDSITIKKILDNLFEIKCELEKNERINGNFKENFKNFLRQAFAQHRLISDKNFAQNRIKELRETIKEVKKAMKGEERLIAISSLEGDIEELRITAGYYV